MASPLGEFVQSYIAAQDQRAKKAREITQQQLEKSRLQIEQQAAQDRVKQLDIENKRQEAYLDLSRRDTTRMENAQKETERKDKVTEQQKAQDELGRQARAKGRLLMQGMGLNLRDKQHADSLTAGLLKFYLSKGVPQGEAQRRAKADLEILGMGLGEGQEDLAPFLSALGGIKPEAPVVPPTQPVQPGQAPQGGNPIYGNPLTPEGKQAPLMEDFLTRQARVFDKYASGDEKGMGLPTIQSHLDLEKEKIKAQQQKNVDYAEDHALKNAALKARTQLSVATRKWVEEQTKDKAKLGDLPQKKLLEEIVHMKALDAHDKALTDKITQEAQVAKDTRQALQSSTDYVSTLKALKKAGNTRAYLNAVKSLPAEAQKARDNVDKYDKEAGKWAAEIIGLDASIRNKPTDPAKVAEWEQKKGDLYPTLKRLYEGQFNAARQQLAEAQAAYNEIQATQQELKKVEIVTPTNKPDNKATEASAAALREKARKHEAEANRLRNQQKSPDSPKKTLAPSGKTLDRSTATQILQEAHGDKAKAREIARKRGYKF